MKFKFQSHDAYYLPEGNYHAEFMKPADAKSTPYCKSPIRLTLEVLYPLPEKLAQRVGRNYCTDCDKNGELLEHLSSAFGSEVESFIDENEDFDADKLTGRRVDISVTHVQTDSYTKPFVKLTAMYPAGTFKLKE
jgi:hypothetical protein